jgi:carbonic anhydrase
LRRPRQLASAAQGPPLTAIDALIENNARYARSFRDSELQAPPRRPVAVVTCMDARLLPSRFFGLKEGDAHIIRNAGGSAREALRSLVISQRMMGTREVAVVKHTDCGMLRATNRDIRRKVAQDLNADASEIDFLTFRSLEQAVRDDVRLLAESPLIDDEVVVRGFIYDVTSGLVSEIG